MKRRTRDDRRDRLLTFTVDQILKEQSYELTEVNALLGFMDCMEVDEETDVLVPEEDAAEDPIEHLARCDYCGTRSLDPSKEGWFRQINGQPCCRSCKFNFINRQPCEKAGLYEGLFEPYTQPRAA